MTRALSITMEELRTWKILNAAYISAEDDKWWRYASFYQLQIRSFKDSNQDGIGDLKGITSKLQYLKDLGITGIWLGPIYKSPMVNFGFDVEDFKEIHEDYGTHDDFNEMMVEAIRLGIKVVMDFIPNHTSNQCEWFKKSCRREKGYESFYIWADGKRNEKGKLRPPNDWKSIISGSAWEWNSERGQYYLHQFNVEEPDLNFRNSNVIKAMDEILYFWLDRGVAGFRMSLFEPIVSNSSAPEIVVPTIDKSSTDIQDEYRINLADVYNIVQHWRALVDGYTDRYLGKRCILISEAYAEVKHVMDYYENIDSKMGAHIPMNFFMIIELTPHSDARDFVYTIQKWLTYMPTGHVANWLLGNPDNSRVASRFRPELVDAMNMLIMTLPGIGITYYGEEIGMEDNRDISWKNTKDPLAKRTGGKNFKTVSRDPIRTPFHWSSQPHAGFTSGNKPWLPISSRYKKINLEDQMKLERSHYHVYRALMQLRKEPTMEDGGCYLTAFNRKVFGIKRTLKSHYTYVTLINLDDKKQNVNLEDFLDCAVNKKVKIHIADTNSSYTEGKKIQVNKIVLAPFEGLVCMA